MSSNNDDNVNGNENDEDNDEDNDKDDGEDNDDDAERTICSSSTGGCGVGALGGSSCFLRAGTAFAALPLRQPIASQDLGVASS